MAGTDLLFIGLILRQFFRKNTDTTERRHSLNFPLLDRVVHRLPGNSYAQCSVKGCNCEDYDKDYPSGGNTLRFFNPNADNYEGEPDEDIRKYCLQDYERAQTLGETWNFVGVRAEAEVQLTGETCQTITSAGLWGIESDSDRDHFRRVETEELDQLKAELHAIGFSKRAITAAFRNIERKEA